MKQLLPTLAVFICLSGMSQDKPKSIYSMQMDSILPKHTIHFADFKGRSLLIVVSASMDTNFSQLLELRKLKQQNTSKLSVVLFPTNDFNTEPVSNEKLAAFLKRFNLPFAIAAKAIVTGPNANPVFQWLVSQQGVTEKKKMLPAGPFQKYLIDKEGRLVQVFDPSERVIMNKNIRSIIETEIKK